MFGVAMGGAITRMSHAIANGRNRNSYPLVSLRNDENT